MSQMRVVVVGASSGLGRCLGIGLAQRGARVALLARRQELIDSAVAEAGDGALAVPCDVTDDGSCRAAIDRVVEELGGIDALLYCTGMGVLSKIEDLEPAIWEQVFATNVIGASQITRLALPHLRDANGAAAYLSSVSASLTSPWPGLASYTVTKAALDKLVEAWRAEHPEIGFTRIIVGECAGGEGEGVSQLMAEWDGDLTMEMFPVWSARGLITDKLMDVDHFVGAVDNVLRSGATTTIPSIAITPRRPI
jgi:NAD(P)-dependent dehydrogenase (short-subunit alcohol dehydrogenase family)